MKQRSIVYVNFLTQRYCCHSCVHPAIARSIAFFSSWFNTLFAAPQSKLSKRLILSFIRVSPNHLRKNVLPLSLSLQYVITSEGIFSTVNFRSDKKGKKLKQEWTQLQLYTHQNHLSAPHQELQHQTVMFDGNNDNLYIVLFMLQQDLMNMSQYHTVLCDGSKGNLWILSQVCKRISFVWRQRGRFLDPS